MERKLEPKLIQYIDNRLSGNALAAKAIIEKDARLIMRLAAQACVGIREVGNNRGPLVSLIQDTVGGPDPVAWCMSYVMSCIAYAELRTGKKSPIIATEHCMTCWNDSPKEMRVKRIPLGGAIIIWRHGSGPSGHTGIVDSCDGETFWAYEGNTGGGTDPNGKIIREGDGVYYTHRPFGDMGDMKLIGFLKPF